MLPHPRCRVPLALQGEGLGRTVGVLARLGRWCGRGVLVLRLLACAPGRQWLPSPPLVRARGRRGVLADDGGGQELVADDDVELGGDGVDGDGAQVGEGVADELTAKGAVEASDDDAFGG